MSRRTSRATRATRPATWRCARRRASTWSSRPRSRRSTRRASRRRCRSARSRCRWRARPGPGHFDGVATVVAILFDLVGAERAYFGQKDAQQVMVIRQMARDLAIGTEVVTCPTVREPDGLALSSRNVHLSPEERAAAPVLRRALIAAREAWLAGERSRRCAARANARGAGHGAARGRRVCLGGRRSHDWRNSTTVDGPALASSWLRRGFGDDAPRSTTRSSGPSVTGTRPRLSGVAVDRRAARVAAPTGACPPYAVAGEGGPRPPSRPRGSGR